MGVHFGDPIRIQLYVVADLAAVGHFHLVHHWEPWRSAGGPAEPPEKVRVGVPCTVSCIATVM